MKVTAIVWLEIVDQTGLTRLIDIMAVHGYLRHLLRGIAKCVCNFVKDSGYISDDAIQ